MVGGLSLWIGMSAAQNSPATPLTLIFDEIWHERGFANPARPAALTVPVASASHAGQMLFTLGATGAGHAPAVSADVLRAQVSESMSLMQGTFRPASR
jgi:hypothetical protein